MKTDGAEVLSKTVTQDEAAILDAWNVALREGTSLQSGRIREAELQTQVKTVFGQLRDALASGGLDADASRVRSRPAMRRLTGACGSDRPSGRSRAARRARHP